MIRSLVGLSLLCSSITLLTISCGSDELTSDDNGSEGGDDGRGSGGTSASGGRAGGSTTNAGRGGASSSSSSLGSACTDTPSCGTGLECLVAGDVLGGLCTAECSSNEDCQAFSALSVCLPQGAGICFEGCQPNAVGDKCHGREDLVCGIYQVVQGDSCVDDGDCTGNELCLGGACRNALTACLPSCDSDADCAEGLGCDLESGQCESEPKQGLPVGSPCTPPVNRDDEDPCSGFCLRYGPGDEDGFCSGSCRIGFNAGIPGCGFEADSSHVDAACLFVSAYLAGREGNGGLCSQLCDCDADCLTPGFSCIDFPVFGRRGQCAPLTDADIAQGITNVPACDGGAGAGAGGEGGAAAGASGAGGSGGSSEGGTGGSTDAGAGQGASPGTPDAGSGGTTG